jgi:hypothetical protein
MPDPSLVEVYVRHSLVNKCFFIMESMNVEEFAAVEARNCT